MTMQSAGGKARAAKLSPERRAEIARKAAAARWGEMPIIDRPIAGPIDWSKQPYPWNEIGPEWRAAVLAEIDGGGSAGERRE